MAPRVPTTDPPGLPRMQRVQSSTIHALAYDADQRLLYVRFHASAPSRHAAPGMVYRFQAVPPAIWRRLVAAPSVGRFFFRQIRGRFGYARWTGATWRGGAALQQDAIRRANIRRMLLLRARRGG